MNPFRWTIVIVVIALLLTAVVVSPYLALVAFENRIAQIQHDNHERNCRTTQNEWLTLDAIIIKVNQTDPGTRAAYEPLLGPEPTC